jgi:hypothetical protein
VLCEPVTSRRNGRFPKLSLSSNLENQPTKLHHTDPSACSLSYRKYLRYFLARLQSLLHEQRTIRDHQFGFRQKHAASEQVHSVTNAIIEALENHKYCTAAFLDISQAFDKVWHEGLICILRTLFPASTHKLLRSYLEQILLDQIQKSLFASSPSSIRLSTRERAVSPLSHVHC